MFKIKLFYLKNLTVKYLVLTFLILTGILSAQIPDSICSAYSQVRFLLRRDGLVMRSVPFVVRFHGSYGAAGADDRVRQNVVCISGRFREQKECSMYGRDKQRDKDRMNDATL